MYIVERTARFVRGFLLSYGPSNIKKKFWDKEYSEEKWSFAYNTVGDCVYAHLERYSGNATILDIGCGSGNTSTEMADIYRSYLGSRYFGSGAGQGPPAQPGVRTRREEQV